MFFNENSTSYATLLPLRQKLADAKGEMCSIEKATRACKHLAPGAYTAQTITEGTGARVNRPHNALQPLNK